MHLFARFASISIPHKQHNLKAHKGRINIDFVGGGGQGGGDRIGRVSFHERSTRPLPNPRFSHPYILGIVLAGPPPSWGSSKISSELNSDEDEEDMLSFRVDSAKIQKFKKSKLAFCEYCQK